MISTWHNLMATSLDHWCVAFEAIGFLAYGVILWSPHGIVRLPPCGTLIIRDWLSNYYQEIILSNKISLIPMVVDVDEVSKVWLTLTIVDGMVPSHLSNFSNISSNISMYATWREKDPKWPLRNSIYLKQRR